MDSGITKGTRVWLALKDSEFVGAEVLQIENEEHVLIQVDGQEVKTFYSILFQLKNYKFVASTS